jgi:hypothetical protein
MNVGELKRQLEKVPDDLTVELMIHYDNAWHIQGLHNCDIASTSYNNEWIVLKGQKEGG